MLPTFVYNKPSGNERGSYLALDLGGTNFRVLLVQLNGRNIPAQIKSRVYHIADSLKTGSGEQLFNYIANCIADFIADKNVKGRKLPLGFTFSFPCAQKDIASGSLISWTKGFTASGVINNDVVQLLRDAIKRQVGAHFLA